MNDLARMELGQAVDSVIEYNDLHEPRGAGKIKNGSDAPSQPQIRKATQADWDAFWG